MNQQIIYNVYMMPGMAANSKIFDFISLPKNFIIHYLEWEIPILMNPLKIIHQESQKKLKAENIVLIGVSFGGIIIQEISKFIKTIKIIIISSIKSKNELPLMMQLSRKTKAYKFFNVKWIDDFESLALFVFGPIIKTRIELYRKYLSVRDENYLNWSIDQIVNWNQKNPPKKIIHIHGVNDLVFPSIYIKKAIFLSGGTHAIILRKASWFNKNLPKLIQRTRFFSFEFASTLFVVLRIPCLSSFLASFNSITASLFLLFCIRIPARLNFAMARS